MIESHRVLALIPARGGSKGVPRKNIRLVGGKPLIAWSIEAARGSRYVDRVLLSSDDTEIIDVAKALGCEVPFRRPAELATDEADALSVVRHAIAALPEQYGYLVLLQPTSPMRTSQDIDGAIELCVERNAPACVGICESEKSPYWMMTLTSDGMMEPVMSSDRIPDRRQVAPRAYALNGAVYVATVPHLTAGQSFFGPGSLGYVMPRERSLDIDSELDLKIADFLLKETCAHHG
ncbi:MAG: acylneuraminate cytidylyltransferase family protein [Xanthobacteraceae bacterium]|nr:acylneuraminate cytidylyltransferase family protein [Xanthobacteraceae bacterium]